jgi:hypothetical protein
MLLYIDIYNNYYILAEQFTSLQPLYDRKRFFLSLLGF